MNTPQGLPQRITEQLDLITTQAKQSFGDDLVSVILYGSAAEGRVRASSDVNMLIVLKRFEKDHVDRIRNSFRTAHAAVQLDIMFILESELDQASEAFAVKFADIISRHIVLDGDDPFAQRSIPREAAIRRLKQILLNLRLRLRERYALVSLREEQLAGVVADFAGPLRACAAAILKLEGRGIFAPKEALLKIVAELQDAQWQSLMTHISEAREHQILPAGTGGSVMFQLMELTGKLEARVQQLDTNG